MKLQNLQKVTWTTLELTGLLEDEESHVHFTRTVKHLALHPYHLNNVKRGLNQILNSSLNSYDKELKGFVLAFTNPTLLSNLGEMFYDSPFIHIEIEADFYVFRPTIGSFLKGIVKKKGLDHIVVLVHKIYTVSIPKPDDTEEWTGELVEIGQEVKCCVNHIDNRSKPPFIRATLKSNCLEGCRLSEDINNIDNVDSTSESKNSTMKIDVSTNEISENNDVSEKERKKHRKKHKKSRESDSNLVCKVENESESSDNLGNDISRIIKSEKKQQCPNMQDTISHTDDSLNNLKVDNIPKKQKKSKKSKSLSDDLNLDEHTESRKAVKRENSIPLESITETETKKRKKHAKKSKEFDPDSENEEKVINTENTISRCIKSEKEKEQHTYKKHVISNDDLFSNNLEDSTSKKHKKNKKTSIKMSDSESEDHVKIKIEKQDSFIDRVTNESRTSYETQIEQNLNKNLEMPKFLKKEVSIEYDTFEEERKKSPKKHTISRNSQLKSVQIKNEDMISDISDKERKKSSKKHVSKDSDSEIRTSYETEIEQNLNKNLEMPKFLKKEVVIEYDTFENERKKSPKKHTISTDSQLKTVQVKNEDDVISDTSDKERKKSPKKHANMSKDVKKIKSENITNSVSDISRAIKFDPEESQHTKYNISTMESDSNLNNSDLEHVSKKSKKKKTSTISSNSELKYPVKVKIENF